MGARSIVILCHLLGRRGCYVGIAPSGMNSTSAGWLMIRSGAGRKREVTSVQASVAHGIF